MGRKAGLSHNEARLRAHLAAKLRSAIGFERGAISRVASELGITKQALSLYLREKATPTSENLRILCAGLKLQLDVEGALITATDFTSHKKEPGAQLSLFDALSGISSEQLQVEIVGRGSESMELRVTIDFTKGITKKED